MLPHPRYNTALSGPQGRHGSETGRDLQDLKTALAADIGAIAENLTGLQPSKRSRKELRFYPSQRLSIAISGPKRGAWHVHDSAEGGGPFELIRHLRGCSFPDAVEWARKWTGIGREGCAQRPAPQPAPIAAETEDAERAKSIEAARHLYNRSQPVAGTLAERYLIDVRGIPAPPGGWPDAVRWHPGTRSLLIAATTADGTVQAVQRVALDAEGQNARDANGRKIKLSRGPQDGACVRLPGINAGGPLLLAEGPETGLSVWRATDYETWIMLGSMAKAELPVGRKAVACADDDAPARDFKQGNAARRLKQALGQWQRTGHDVVQATPWAQRREDKSDFNDVIRADGIEAVRARIEWALSPGFKVPQRVSVEDARAQRDRVTEAFYAAQAAWQPPAEDDPAPVPPPVHMVKLDTGAGKSEANRRYGASMLARMRAAGDQDTLAIGVPRLDLGDEQATAFNALPLAVAANLIARVWRGRDRPDPAMPGKAMCHDQEAVKLVREAGGNVQAQACGTGKLGEPTCEHFWKCGYQRQKRQERPDAWFVAHELLFTQTPKELGDLAAVVVDESFRKAGLKDMKEGPSVFPLDCLDGPATVHRSLAETEHLKWMRHRLLGLLRDMPDGPVLAAPLIEAALLPGDVDLARREEWARKVLPDMHPGMAADDRRAAAEAAAVNRDVSRLAGLWDALKPLVTAGGPKQSGWVKLTRSDDGARMLSVCRHKDVRKGWQVSTLILNATLSPPLVLPFYPQAELVADIRVRTPHMRVRQVSDKAYAKAMLAPATKEQEKAHPENADYRRRNLKRLRAILFREARTYAPGKVLVVVQEDVENGLKALGPLPPNADMAHHNDVAGRDEWRNVRALIVVGRTQPSPKAVEFMAEQLTGRAITPQASYTRAATVREMADGKAVAAEADRHDDPTAEAIRWEIAEGELLQIIGRVRAVNRTADNPVDVLVMCDAVLPLPVDELLTAKALDPSPDDRMLAEGGFVFVNPTDAAAAYDELWLTRNAAKKAMEDAERLGSNPNKKVYIKARPQPLTRVAYQVAAPGRRRVEALFDPAMVSDPRAWLETRLKASLSHFEIIEEPMTEQVGLQPAALPPSIRQAVPVQVERVPTPQPAIEKERAMTNPAPEPVAPEPTFTTVAPWPEGKPLPDELPVDKLERWEVMPTRYRTAWRCLHQSPPAPRRMSPQQGPVPLYVT